MISTLGDLDSALQFTPFRFCLLRMPSALSSVFFQFLFEDIGRDNFPSLVVKTVHKTVVLAAPSCWGTTCFYGSPLCIGLGFELPYAPATHKLRKLRRHLLQIFLQDIGCDDISILAGDVVDKCTSVVYSLWGHERGDPFFDGPLRDPFFSELPYLLIANAV